MANSPQPPAPPRLNGRLVLQGMTLVVLIILFVATATAGNPESSLTLATPLRAQAGMNLATRTPTVTSSIRASVPSIGSKISTFNSSVPGQTQVDANTIALYHFDSPTGSIALDATGQYTGTMYGNATINSTGLYAGVLALDGANSYVRVGNLHHNNNPIDLSQGTIEAFVDFSQACQNPSSNFTIISAGGEVGSNQPILKIIESTGLFFGIYANGEWHWANSGINGCRYLEAGHPSNPPPWEYLPVLWPYETWRFHHVAGTWGPRGMEIWVDGVLHGVGTIDPDSTYPYKYMCNPQMQEMAGFPPARCSTPALAPNMPAYPPGDYTGGLPPYSTFLIGCGVDVNDNCITGRIDEVRISNIQRTFDWTLVPTITPTPTYTPINIGLGEYPVDANTRGLFHLNFQVGNGVLEEASQLYKGLAGQASITSNGRFGAGLALDGNGSFLDPSNLGYLGGGTVEAWVKFQNPPQASLPLFMAFGAGPGPIMYFGDTGLHQIGLGLSDGSNVNWVYANGSTTALTGCWHHWAGAWGPRGMEIWLDGSLNSVSGYTGGMLTYTSSWRVGCATGLSCVPSTLDEVRVSTLQRVFTPRMLARDLTELKNQSPLLGSSVYLPLIFGGPTPNPACPFGF